MLFTAAAIPVSRVPHLRGAGISSTLTTKSTEGSEKGKKALCTMWFHNHFNYIFLQLPAATTTHPQPTTSRHTHPLTRSPRSSKVIQKQHLNKLHTSYAKKTPKTNNLKTIPSNPSHCYPKKFIWRNKTWKALSSQAAQVPASTPSQK